MRTIIWVFNWDRNVNLCGGGRTSPSLSGRLKKAQTRVRGYYKQLIKVVWFESFHCVPIPSRVPNYPIYPSWDWILIKKKKKTLHCHSWNHTYHFPVDFFSSCKGLTGTKWNWISGMIPMWSSATSRLVLVQQLMTYWTQTLGRCRCCIIRCIRHPLGCITWLQGSTCHSSQGFRLQLILSGGGRPARNWQWNGRRLRWWSWLSMHWISRILKPPLQFREHWTKNRSKDRTWVLGMRAPYPITVQVPGS